MINYKVPKIRFKEFNTDWKTKKLRDLAQFSKGNSYTKSDLVNSGQEIVLYGQLYTEYKTVIYESSQFISKIKSNAIFSKGGEVVVPASGESAKDISRASVILKSGIVLGGDLNIIKPDSEIVNPIFLALTISNGTQQKELIKRAQGKSIVHLRNNDLKEVKLTYSSLSEQSKIGSLFSAIDSLLSSYKDNLENYLSFKKTMLSKMFPKAGQTVPEIRLDGFEGEWERRNLKTLVERVTRKNSELVSERALTISAQYGLVDQEFFFNKKVASKDVSGYFLIEKGEFAYNKSYSNGYPLGAIKRLDNYDYGVLSTLYILFKPTDINSDFLAWYYESNHWHKEVSKCAAEGARNHGLLNIAPVDFFNTVLEIPKNKAEQQAIGSFFSNLDELISSYQSKIAELESLKKKLLQDMFI